MKRVSVVFVIAFPIGCGGRAVPLPPPFAGAPPGPPAEIGESGSAGGAPTQSSSKDSVTALAGAPPGSATPAAPAAPPQIQIKVESAYKLDAMPLPKDKHVFQMELAERWRWNHGGVGALAAEVPAPEGHPMPRVIIDVTHVFGPHKPADVQRLARRNHWIKVIGCYALGAYKDQKLRGKTRVSFAITAAGKVESTRTESTTLADEAVAACFSEELRHLEMPKAKARSIVSAEIHVSPGDEPMAPPKEILKPGDGVLDLDAARNVVLEAEPRFEACYARALLYAPELWGRIAIRFHVTEKGKLDEAFETESRFPDEAVTICVLHHARELRFAKPKDGDERFVVPLRFATPRAHTEADAVPEPESVPPKNP